MSYKVNIIFETRSLHSHKLSLVNKCTFFCFLFDKRLLNLESRKLISTRARQFQFFLSKNLVNKSISLTFRKLSLAIYAPVGNARIHIGCRYFFLSLGFVFDDIFLLAVGYKSFYSIKHPIVIRAVISLYSPFLSLASCLCPIFNSPRVILIK